MQTVQQPPTRRSRRGGRGDRRRLSFVGVLGDLLVTAGVVVLLFVVWQLWIGDAIIGAQFKDEASNLTDEWANSAPAAPAPSVTPTPGTTGPATAEPPALDQPGDGEVFGVLRVPRLGADWQFKLAGGVSASVTLDPIGLGHYPDTSMPGQVGNFAIAGHRGSHGAPFADLPSLRVGDAVVVETEGGWYTYRFRNLEYVRPDGVEVLLPFPQAPQIEATDRVITMTTCSPRYGFSERAIAYGVFESFTPRTDAGPPVSLTSGAA
ncbi:class E sortase [Microbacterium sp. BH-3-3-3]|uniref:class E sortase n=1 Tax=Microbacterium sp. BH-3-3-3 TaxID=1906742 RepID=UPI00089289C7|nr:class E sortase [Microbacterium sp. BH-3-3-3]AOX45911.1 class E sortase [Microbacterium sp. BH-3-3-3]